MIETANVVLDDGYVVGHPGSTTGPHVLLAVRDTGCGMDEQTVERIFEPFFTTKAVGQGTGLGLSTVYGIVKQANGHVTADSDPGTGTLFRIYLPALGTTAEASHAQPATAGSNNNGHETVLLCEDEESVRTLACRVLEYGGYTVLCAENATHAQVLADEHGGPIHLLLTDVIMPDMNGRRLADAIRSKRPDTRVLYVSGYPANVIARHGVLDEGVNFLQKPFSFHSLLSQVRLVLDENCRQVSHC
jgi:CheY-like chemotaxis protein